MHLTSFEDYANQVTQAGDEADYATAAGVLTVTMSHIAEHLTFLEGNPAYAAEIDQFTQVLSDLKTLLGKWTSAAKRQQEAAQREQEQQQAASDDVVIAVEKEKIKTEALLQERLAKEESLSANREAKTVHSMRLKEASAAQKMRLEAAKAVTQGE